MQKRNPRQRQRLNTSDRDDIKHMILGAFNTETFVEEFRARYGSLPDLGSMENLPTDPHERRMFAEDFARLEEF